MTELETPQVNVNILENTIHELGSSRAIRVGGQDSA